MMGHLFLQQGRVTAHSSGSPSWAAGGPARGGLFDQGVGWCRAELNPNCLCHGSSGGCVQRSRSGCHISQDPFQVSFSPPSVLIPPWTSRKCTGKIRTRSPTSAAQRISPSSASERPGQLVCHSVPGGPVTVTRGILSFRKDAMNAICPHFGVLFVGILTSRVRPPRVLWWDSDRISDQPLRPQTTD